MADLSLSPAPSAAAPVAAPAPVASRPAAEPLRAETADLDDDKEETETLTRAAPAVPKATVAGTASSSEALGGFIPDLFSDGTDAASSGISTGRALQPLPTVTKVGAAPTGTESSLSDKVSKVANECTSPDTSCNDSLNRTMGITIPSLFVVIMIGVALYVLIRRRRRRHARESGGPA